MKFVEAEHSASDLEVYVKSSADKPVTRLYFYLGLMHDRVPRLAKQAVDSGIRPGNRPH